MNRTSLRQLAAPLGLVLAAILCWFAAGAIADRMVQQELAAALRAQRQVTSSIVDNMAEVIASDLALSRAIPSTMAELDAVQDVLTAVRQYTPDDGKSDAGRLAQLAGVPALAAINRFLHDAQGFSGLDAIWLINVNGLCVASSNATGAHPYIGRDMRTRPYFVSTRLGAFTEGYGVGRQSGDPGIFIAAPVYDEGMLVGAVVARMSLSRLRHWVAHPGSFVTDQNGVIIMANDNRLEGRTLPNAAALTMNPGERVNMYLRDRFPPLEIRSLSADMRAEEPWVPTAAAAQLFDMPRHRTPALYESRGGLNSGLSAHLVDPIATWPELHRSHGRDRLLVFLTLVGTVTLTWVITVSWTRELRHHRATRDLAEQLQAANALLAAEARHDALTGALSRRYFLDLLRHEIDRARASGTPLCMAIADLDHFKQINDCYGHAAGDHALEHFVDTCRAELRGTDAVGRLGGEEFGIVLPSTRLAEGIEVMERLRKRFKGSQPAKLPEDVELAVSIGITEYAPDDPPERLISRADIALYAAKSAGRDRTEARAPDDTSPSPRTAANASWQA